MVYMRARAIRPQVLAEMEARKLAENGLDATDSTAELGEISRDASKLSEFTLDEAGSARYSMIKRGSSFYLLNTPSLPHIPCAPRSPRTTLTMCRSGRASQRNRRRSQAERRRLVRLLQLEVQHGPRATQVLARQPVLGAPAGPDRVASECAAVLLCCPVVATLCCTVHYSSTPTASPPSAIFPSTLGTRRVLLSRRPSWLAWLRRCLRRNAS